jgi:hypothetical protein
VFGIAPLAENLSAMGFSGIDDFRHLRFGHKEFFEPLLYTYKTPANSDYHSFVDLNAVKHRFMGNTVKELDDLRVFIIPARKIIFADTFYVNLTPKRVIPDIFNLQEIQRAKTMAQDLALSSTHSIAAGNLSDPASPAPIFVLDYAYAFPYKTTFPQVQSAIIQILQRTLPFLSADEMREVWDIIEKKISNMDLDASDYKWIDYFKALCYFDVKGMRDLSMELLPDEGAISDHYSHQMLMATLLASSAVLGDVSDIEKYWDRYDERNDPPAPIRVAKALLGL